jgi:hypothetical protein
VGEEGASQDAFSIEAIDGAVKLLVRKLSGGSGSGVTSIDMDDTGAVMINGKDYYRVPRK